MGGLDCNPVVPALPRSRTHFVLRYHEVIGTVNTFYPCPTARPTVPRSELPFTGVYPTTFQLHGYRLKKEVGIEADFVTRGELEEKVVAKKEEGAHNKCY
jgi:hypothetical protein